MPEKITGALQENILILLCFSDEVKMLSNVITVDLFESSIYRDVASAALDFYREFQKPIAEHLPDVLHYQLESPKGELFKHVLDAIFQSKDSINKNYVMKQLEKFIRQQKLKQTVKETADKILDGDLEGAEQVFDKYKKTMLKQFDIGTKLSDTVKSLRFLKEETQSHHTGIKLLDELGICPAPKELFVFVSLPGYGKSWFFIHIGKYALMQRKKILHVTLEMSEENVCKRYIQSLFNISKQSLDSHSIPVFTRTEEGILSSIDFKEIKKKTLGLTDEGIEKTINSKLKKLKKPQVIVKEFPTGSLTMRTLNAYLDNLEASIKFIPDIIIVDYADLMSIDKDNVRVATGRTYQELRGLAVERNLSVVTASQANRTAEGIKWITRKQLAEDYSKVAIADNLVTFNQTPAEYKLKLARLFIDKGRNDRSGDAILISQNYALGQFCMDSIRMDNEYWKILPQGDLP